MTDTSRGALLAYVRHQRLQSDPLPKRFGPKPSDHPSNGDYCPVCGEDFKTGDYTTLVPLGPGDDPESQEKARAGRWYNAVAIECHWICVTGQEE